MIELFTRYEIAKDAGKSGEERHRVLALVLESFGSLLAHYVPSHSSILTSLEHSLFGLWPIIPQRQKSWTASASYNPSPTFGRCTLDSGSLRDLGLASRASGPILSRSKHIVHRRVGRYPIGMPMNQKHLVHKARTEFSDRLFTILSLSRISTRAKT